jgi:hypothetical protein
MNRRRFLELSGVIVPAVVIPKKTYFFFEGLWRPEKLWFHRDAFALVWGDLPVPVQIVKATQLGFTMHVRRAYDVKTGQSKCIIDLLYGPGNSTHEGVSRP